MHHFLSGREFRVPPGDVIYTSVVGRPAIILNSAEAARDLMDKQSANFSDRPRTVLHGELYVLVLII